MDALPGGGVPLALVTLAIPVLIAADTTTGVDLSVFAQYGVVGVIALMGIWFAKIAYQRERERADRLETENRRLNEVIQDRIIPAMTAATQAAERSMELLRDMQQDRDRTVERAGRAERRRPSSRNGDG
jgi:hypothetical protein